MSNTDARKRKDLLTLELLRTKISNALVPTLLSLSRLAAFVLLVPIVGILLSHHLERSGSLVHADASIVGATLGLFAILVIGNLLGWFMKSLQRPQPATRKATIGWYQLKLGQPIKPLQIKIFPAKKHD